MDRSVLVAALLAAAVLLLAGVAARGEAVAVFNFQMTSETPEWRWLEKGLADRIATDFAQDRSQTVIARDEMQLLAQKMAWVPEMATTDAGRMGEIRKQLKIAHLVTGVYEVAGDQIRLIGQVVELEGRREVARKELAGPAAEVLDLQRRLSAELLAWFSKKPAAQILQTLPVWTRSLPAAKALYEGMDLYDQGRYGEAWLQFRQASREDPGYVEAVYWVGKMYYFMNRYEHARRMLERFVYLDTAHPRLGDAMVEYVHTYESADAGAEALLSLYEDLARRFPNANVWQGPRWGNAGNLRSDDWFRFKRMHVISQLGRAADVLKMGGPILDSYLWAPENGGSGAYPYGLVSLLEHYARTAELLPFTIGMGGTVLGGVPRRLAAQEGSTTWLRFDDATAPQTVRTVPRRLTGAARAGADRQTVLDEPWAILRIGLRAPSGAVFESLRFQADVEGDQGYLEVRLRRADTFAPWLGYAEPVRSDLKRACRQGIEVKDPPLSPIIVAECRFGVADAQSGPIVVKGVTVTPRFTRVRTPGTLRVSCRNTSDFIVFVDGALARWNPGRVGPLAPGKHAVRFAPVAEGTPFGEWTTEVKVQPNRETPLAATLPWAQGSPWQAWRPVPVGDADPAPDPSLWRWSRGAPAIQADDDAIRLVWSCRGDLWASVSTDGETFSPPRRLDLPVSSGWDETSPALVRDEAGRFVLVFLSCRDARHRTLPYVAWSRDFVHWSAPALVCEDAVSEGYTFLADDRGRLVFVCRAGSQYSVRVSTDASRWVASQAPAGVLMQDRTGLYACYDLASDRPPDKPLGTDGAGAATEYRLRRWTSSDLVTWSPEEAAGTFKVEGTFPTDRLYALDGEGGPAILGFGASWEKTWDLGLIEPGPDGKWCVAGRLWGLLPGTARPVYHPRWGYLLAAVSAESHEWWPQDPSGPFVLRGPDLKPLREWRNPLPPLAGRTEATPEKKTELADKMAPQVHLGVQALGKPFNAIRDFWESPRASKVPVGELAYVYAFAPRSHALEGSQHFRPPAPNRGTVHPKARVVAIDLGGQRVAVALDAEKADAKYYDVLRLDLTGKGDFRDALQVPRIYLRPQPGAPGQGTAEYEFAAAFPAMPVGPRRVGAGIVIGYEEGATLGSAAKLWYGFSTCAVGECRFGDKVYKVRFRDHTGNLSVRDTQGPDRAEGYAGRRIKGRYGDWFCVDCYEDGDKVRWASNIRGDPILYGDREWHINEQCIPQALYGQPVLVDGRWWDVRVTEDGGHVAAEPSTGPMAQIQLDHPFWRLILIGPSAVLHVQGGKEPVPVPAGRYEVYCYDEYLAPTPNYASNVLDVTTWTERAGRRNGMTLDLKAGTTTPVRLGSPLRATIVVTKEPGALCFRIDLKDAAGRGASVSSLLHGKAPTRFLLTGGSGERAAVFEATSLYEAVRRGWKIPAGFRGTYTVTAEFPGNFPIESEPVTVTVP